MIIVRIQGGLGNQLFQYALYESFKGMGREVRADITGYLNGREHRELELNKLGIRVVNADKSELHSYFADNTAWSDRILRYTLGRRKYIKENSSDFDPVILKLEMGYLSGYWQSEKYFDTVITEIRKNIYFQNVDTDLVKARENQMKEQNSVSVHVRMGDYLLKPDMYGGICTAEYYNKAITYILENVENPVFYVFSDEPEKAEELLKGHKYYLVTENRGENAYKDMYLMSRCKHHIIANSTFSWWGAWLGDEPDKIVITPPKWNHLCKANDICCGGWIML